MSNKYMTINEQSTLINMNNVSNQTHNNSSTRLRHILREGKRLRHIFEGAAKRGAEGISYETEDMFDTSQDILLKTCLTKRKTYLRHILIHTT